MSIFSALDSKFQIIDFSATHSQLLIRSPKNRTRIHNIDIIIKGVINLTIPISFNGFDISILDDPQKVSLLSTTFNFSREYDNRIFQVQNKLNQNYFVNALCFGVYHNELDILDTSIGRYDMDDHGELQLWYAE